MEGKDPNELAAEHWCYIKNLLTVTLIQGDPFTYEKWFENVEFHYLTAFVHGYKHGAEDERSKMHSLR